MKIAIVGVSGQKMDKFEREKALREIIKIVKSHEEPIIVSGRSPRGGIDAIAELYADEEGLEKKIFPPKRCDLESYRRRNKKIAEECDILYCISTIKKEKWCYHCMQQTHEKTGGCWTMKMAKELGKPTELVIL